MIIHSCNIFQRGFYRFSSFKPTGGSGAEGKFECFPWSREPNFINKFRIPITAE